MFILGERNLSFELLCWLCDCGYRGNTKANTGRTIYSVVKETHVVLI